MYIAGGAANGLYSALDSAGASSGPTTGFAVYSVNSQLVPYNVATFVAFTTNGFTCECPLSLRYSAEFTPAAST